MYAEYKRDVSHKVRPNTWEEKEYIILTKILPYLGKRKINELKVTDIFEWQREIQSLTTQNGKSFSKSYLGTIHNQLSAMFNHAVRYYGLKWNVASKAGNMGSARDRNVDFWTQKEYQKFIEQVADKPQSFYGFEILYWCGLRIGELLALTPKDFDFENNVLKITKSYKKVKGKDIVTDPKTPKSIRDIVIPEFLAEAANRRVSDIFIIAGRPLAEKIDGHLLDRGDRLMPDQTENLLRTIYGLAENRDISRLMETGDDDFSFSIPGVSRFRVNAYKQRGSLAAVIRVIAFRLPDPAELSIPEDVMNIIDFEKPDGVIASLGGQTAINLAQPLHDRGVKIIGTGCEAIDRAENRDAFEKLLKELNIPQPKGKAVTRIEDGVAAAREIGYPVLVRPSFVLGGRAMQIVTNEEQLRHYLHTAVEIDADKPVLVDKYIRGKEVEIDAICDGTDVFVPGIMELVERTGVHSGDSICVYPAQHLTQAEIDTMVDYTGRFARELHVTGLVNVQYAVSNGKVYVIEVNPRSSRTVPYISKVTGVPMVDLAVRCCLGEKLTDMGYGTGLHPNAPYVAVKVPVFSFEKLHGVDTQFGPEMKSTGEVLGIAPNFHDALLKGLIGAGYTFKTPGPASCCIFTVKDSDKPEFVDIAWKLKSMGYKLYGTSGTCAWLNKHMVPCNEVRNMSGEAPNIVDLLQSGLVDYVFSTSAKGRDPKRDSVRLRRKAVELSIPCITAVDTANALVDCLRSDHSMKDIPLVDIATLYHKK